MSLDFVCLVGMLLCPPFFLPRHLKGSIMTVERARARDSDRDRERERERERVSSSGKSLIVDDVDDGKQLILFFTR